MYLSEKNPHGGDIYTHKIELDFSANVNPFGIPECVRAAAKKAIENSIAYPDPYCRELRKKLSVKEKVPAESILCGNGAAELIYSFAYSLPKDEPALVVSPAFSEYEAALSAAGITAEHFLLKEENGFELSEEILTTDFSNYSALFLCTPNNPTGKMIKPELLERLLKTNIRIFCDFCFLDLTDDPGRYDTAGLVREYPNLIALKAFTKTFALPGLRLGYVLSSDLAFLDEMAQKTSCWNVSVPAQAAGCEALDCEEWLSETVKKISEERKRLSKALKKLGITVFSGEANFLLLYTEADLMNRLLEKGILVRDCSNYIGLGKGFYRIAVRKKEENDRLLYAMKEVL